MNTGFASITSPHVRVPHHVAGQPQQRQAVNP